MPAAVSLIPREVLLGQPDRMSAQISPDGASLGYLAPLDGVLNIWVGPIGADATPLTSDTDRGIRQWAYAWDDTHVLYVQDAGGDENWHLYATTIADGHTRDLTPLAGVRAQLVQVSPDHPGSVLVGLNDRDPQLHDVYRIDLATAERVLVAENPGVVDWTADHAQRVRGAVTPTPDGGMQIMVRDTEEAAWRTVVDAGMEDALSTQPLDFDGSGEGLYLLTSVGAEAARFVRLDLTTNQEEVLADGGPFDVTTVQMNPLTHLPEAVGILRDRLTWEVLDPQVAQDFEAIRMVHSGDFAVVSRTRDLRNWVIAFTADNGPVTYVLWDRDRQSARTLFVHQPALEGLALAPHEPFTFTTSDGLEVSGYVTVPVGVERARLPAVLNVHGGPWARDQWGFNPEAQWLANRGYVCIQVNYRGSTGYGKSFVNAGDREWAGAMQRDLEEAVDHFVTEGLVDPDRVAIYGGSYGGYAALVGATFTPERYVCAVDIVGPSDLRTLIRSVPPYWVPIIEQFHRRVGNPDVDDEFLWSRSPLSRVDDISVPLLIAQGANDPRVKRAESDQIVAALVAKNIPHEYVVYDDEGHGFAKPQNRIDFYRRAEAFLATHLGGRFEE
ncbi:MAG: S9 family peptidase [Acidimicrobiales bacterium]